ncbi:uncharacterized protein LOC111047758 isoform X5 [Nilaparvata lugens]|uniref:uncharacterized protein LOC111047758 isoform X5 n=1 Tax=Nilaparvata lugens TaxID=108931 RepID=UPI00193D2647|nr:uncharacterized protein LOC111047758 isoform X5 [Nilaparvata lugens]
MAEQLDVGRAEPELDKESIQSGSGSCVFNQSEESSGGHVSALVKTASPEPLTLELMDFVGSFPEEVTDMILTLLSANDLENCSSVSQLWSSTIKRFQLQQISRLKYNWENGKYSVHCFPISNEISYSYVLGVDELASNYRYDQCPYFFAYGTEDGFLCRPIFSVVHIDAELRKKCSNNFQSAGFFCRVDEVDEVCIMGGSIMWTSVNESSGALYYYNALLEPDTEMKTIDRWNFSNPNDIWKPIFLKMDSNYIVFSYKKRYVKAWCKHTLELKFEQKCRDDALQQISLFDGCLVISYTFKAESTSVIEIHNLKSDSNNGSTLKHTFTVDGQVVSLYSNRHFIFLSFKFEYKFIQVFSKQSFSQIYSYNYVSPFHIAHYKTHRCRIESVHANYIVVNDGPKCERYRILNLVTKKMFYIPSYAEKLWPVFDNIAVIHNCFDKSLQVFDWERNTQLLTLAIPKQISDKYVVVGVTGLRIIILDTSSNQVVVFKFG